MNWDFIFRFLLLSLWVFGSPKLAKAQSIQADTQNIKETQNIVKMQNIVDAQNIAFLPPKTKNTYKSYKIWLAPACLMAASALVYGSGPGLSDTKIRASARSLTGAGFHTRLDDVLWFLPAAIAFGAPVFGQPTSQNLPDKIQTFVQTEIFTFLLIYPTKGIVGKARPQTAEPEAWPSGHTGQAFACAAFMQHQLGDAHWGYGVAAYSMASATGVLRILNDRHWASDVLAGAALGTLSGNLAWYLQKYMPHYKPIKGWQIRATPIAGPHYGFAIQMSK